MAERESVEAADESRTCRGVIAAVRALAPLIVGIAVARTGLIASSYSSYRSSDEGLFTDGATLLALVVLLIPFAIIAKSRKTIPKAWVSRIAAVSFVVEMLSASSIGLLHLFDVHSVASHLTLSVICTLSASSSMFYWLRRLRGTGTVVTVAYVFSALILSEFILFATALMGPAVGSIVAGLLALAQFPCKRISYRRTTLYSKDQLTAEKAFPGFDEDTLKSRQLLVAMAVSIGLLGVVSGFLRGYPDGDAIPLGLITRIGYALLTVALSIAAIVLTAGKHRSIMPVDFFIILEALACLALVFYAAFPDMLEVGALFTTTLNALMVGLAWHIVIAFMSFGWRDAYLLRAGRVVRLARRALAHAHGVSRHHRPRWKPRVRHSDYGRLGCSLNAGYARPVPRHRAQARRARGKRSGAEGRGRFGHRHAHHGTQPGDRSGKPEADQHEAFRRDHGKAVPAFGARG